VAQQLQLMSHKESGRESLDGKMSELELQNFNNNAKTMTGIRIDV